MNNETKAKFAALLAAQQANQPKPNFKAITGPDNTIKLSDLVKYKGATDTAKVLQIDNTGYTPTAIIKYNDTTAKQAAIEDLQKIEPIQAKMVSFTILWHEGTGKQDGKTFQTWNAANEGMTAIYNEHKGRGYLKTAISIKWENGHEITKFRADCSDNGSDFSPLKNTIGEYLKNIFDYSELSFKDSEETTAAIQATTQPQTAIQTEYLPDYEFSNMTIADLLDEPQEQVKPEIIAPILKLVDYSERGFAIVVPNYDKLSKEDAKLVNQKLQDCGGKFNAYLKCGKGYIFPKKRAYTVRKALNLI